MSSVSPLEPRADALIVTKQPPTASVASSLKQPSDSSQRQHLLDAKLDRLIKDVLPSAPYLLRLRSRSAQYHGRDRYYWRKDTLFNEDEEELQYLTFRQTHDGTILYAHGQWDDGNGGIAPKELPSSQTSRGQTPVIGQVAKKKISLADYAKMDKTKPRTPNTNVSMVKEPIGKTSREVSDGSKKESGQKKSEIQHGSRSDSNFKSFESNEKSVNSVRKRSADNMIEASDAAIVEHETLPPPSKKSRLKDQPVGDSASKQQREHGIESQAQAPSPVGAPGVLENEKPESGENENPMPKRSITSDGSSSAQKAKVAPLHGLPPMLSPTLPAEIEEELAKRTPGNHGGFASSRVSSISPGAHSKDHKSVISSGSKVKSSSKNSAPSTPKHNPRDSKQITSAPRQQHEEDASDLTVEPVILKKTKIVKLKIRNKVNRRTLMQYLRMKPTPNRGSQKTTTKSESANVTHDINSSKLSSQPKPSRQTKLSKEDESSDTDEPLAMRKSKKRRVAEIDDDELGRSNAKRGKVSIQKQQDHPSRQSHPSRQTSSSNRDQVYTATVSTPTQTLSNSAQKAHLNIVSTAMQRTASQESAATPARDITPTANGHKPESPERREWKREVKIEMNRLLKLATEIKHDSDVYLKHFSGREYQEHRELGSVIATEATLCFMLAAIVNDEPGRSSSTPSNTDLWKSTRDFISSLSSNHAKKLQYLFGFLKQLEGLVCDTLTYQHDLRGDAILREYNRLKGQEAVATTANADSYIAENWNFLKEAQETRFRARAAWREGHHGLFDPELEREFPKTWSHRRSFPGRGKGRDPVFLNNYGKEGFSLPLGINSTALDAVNFGLSFLAELCEKDGIEWKPKLIL